MAALALPEKTFENKQTELAELGHACPGSLAFTLTSGLKKGFITVEDKQIIEAIDFLRKRKYLVTLTGTQSGPYYGSIRILLEVKI